MDDGRQWQGHNDVTGVTGWASYADHFDTQGHLVAQTGTQDDGNTLRDTHADGHLVTRTRHDDNNGGD
jgi:hypothetical protein